jgi:hypothetical protein
LVFLIILNAIFAGHSLVLLKGFSKIFTLVNEFDVKTVNPEKFWPHLISG